MPFFLNSRCLRTDYNLLLLLLVGIMRERADGPSSLISDLVETIKPFARPDIVVDFASSWSLFLELPRTSSFVLKVRFFFGMNATPLPIFRLLYFYVDRVTLFVIVFSMCR